MEDGINRSYYMTPTKETLEVPNATKDTTIPKVNANASASAGHLRADAVSLDVPVKVHGTRVIEAARGAVPQTEPFEETTSTMIVFPLGAVVKMETAVVGGQMVVVTNLKSGHDAICRIVKVRPYAQKHCYVEIEFTHRQPGYWGVHFASDSPADASLIGASSAAGNAQAAPTVSLGMKIEKGHDADGDEKVWEIAGNSLPKLGSIGVVNVPAAPLPAPSAASVAAPAAAVRPGKSESIFAPIGSQEEVQAAASATTAFGVDSFTRSERGAQAGGKNGHSATAEISESLALAAESGHALSQPAHVAPFGRFAAATNLGNVVAESIRESATSYIEARKQRPKLSPMVLGVAALLVTVVGGVLFFYLGPFTSAGSAPAATAPVSSPVAANNLATASAVATAKMAVPPAAAVIATNLPVRAAERAPEKVSKAPVKETPPPAAPVQEAAQPAAPVHVKPAPKVPDMFGALNAHPVSPQRESDLAGAQAAPSIDATGASGPLKALPSSIAPLSPLGVTSAPVQSGSLLKPPKLVSSVLPVYPQIAQSAGVDGDVVIQASLDQNGNVAAAKALAGPLMLRQAAIDAVRRWKYEPALLDGKPVPTEMTVRIRFHR